LVDNYSNDGDKVLPWFIVNQLPAGLTGLMIASIFATGMSTVSTGINSSTTVILTDFFKLPSEHPETGWKSMLVLYLSSFVFSVLAIFIAVAMINVQSALDAWWKLASIFSGGMLGLFLLGFLAPRVKNIVAVIGVAAGVHVIGWMSLSPRIFTEEKLLKYASPFHSYFSIVFGTVAIFIMGFLLGNSANKLFKGIKPPA
jgi:solute:Na+ symporter, SSS family